METMAEIIEIEAGKIIEEIRGQTAITQRQLAEFLWPYKETEEGELKGDPLTTYQMITRKKTAMRRLKLGEFYDAIRFLDADFLEVMAEVQKRTREAVKTHECKVSRPPPARKRKAALRKTGTLGE